jgi:hypothetical protein
MFSHGVNDGLPGLQLDNADLRQPGKASGGKRFI